MRKTTEYNNLFNFLKVKTLPYIKNKIKDDDSAEDFFQISFIKLYIKYGLDIEHKRAYNIMLSIIRNQIIDHFRKVKKSKVELVDSFDFIRIDNVEYDYEIEVKANLVKSISNSLSSKYKEVFDMYVINGYTHNEISNELNIKCGTSKSNFFKAKNKIKKQFELEYFKK